MATIDLSNPGTGTVDRTILRFLAAVQAEFGDRLRGAYLFGSRARGDSQPDSDVDLAVIFDATEAERWPLEDRLSEISWPLFIEGGPYLDVRVVTEAQWIDPLQHPNPVLVEEMHRDARRVDIREGTVGQGDGRGR